MTRSVRVQHVRRWTWWWTLALACCWTDVAAAQVDVIRGRVTTVEGQPLGGVRVTATSIPGNVTRATRTDARGGFQIAFPGGQGDYIMGYALVGYAFRQFQVKRTIDQDVLLADTRLQPVQLDTVVTTAPVQQRVGRYNTTTPDVGGTERRTDPNAIPFEQQGNLAAIAASLPGVSLVPGLDGAPDGFSVLGLDADANSTTLNGLAFGANGLPRDAGISSSLVTSPFDPSRGGFSGGNLNLTTRSGSNFLNRGINLVTSSPRTQWTDRAARAIGAEATNVSVGGLLSGPLVYNKAFYNVSYQVDRSARPNQTLLNTGPLGFRTAGVAPDSVERFLGLLGTRGIPTVAGPGLDDRVNSSATVFGSIDIQPPNAVNGDAYSIAFNGNVARQRQVGGGVAQLQSASGDRVNWSGGVQLRTNRYLGLILSETSAGLNLARTYGDPYLDLPLGRVRVNSALDDGASGVQQLVLGGTQGLFSSSRSIGGTLQNALSWFDDANRHRIKLTTELQYNASRDNVASNLLGTFSFNSLEDFDAGRPASFTRQLTQRERDIGTVTAAMSLGDSWRRTPDLQIQYGLRVEHTRFAQAPRANGAVHELLGVRNERVPMPVLVSPRIGFSWAIGNAPQLGAFPGAVVNVRSVVRGGIGVFSNSGASGTLGSAIDNTGLPDGIQQLVCTGDAAPAPDWGAYLAGGAAIPDRCADGTAGSVFANPSPNVVLFSKAFRPQQAVRANLSWFGPILDNRFTMTVEGTFSLNRHLQQSVDLNVRRDRQFALDGEAGRPVYVAPASIDPVTGAVAARDGRITDQFNRVTEVRSDLSSQTSQFSVRLAPIARGLPRVAWTGAYTFTWVREQVPGFQSTAGDPFAREWAVGGIGPHQLSYTLRYTLFNAVTINWAGQFRSGAAFTPVVAGDINGDGYGNDRAFIADPATVADPDLAAELRQLLAAVPGATRACLERQMGRVAARNSCRAPWSSTASLNLTLDRARFRMPQRAAVNLSLTNPLGAADLVLHGSGRLKGWGQAPFPDQALYYVRGFDSATRQYRYEVNQRFGQTRPQFLTLRAPVTMTVSMRIDLGPTTQRQTLEQRLKVGREQPGRLIDEAQFRQFGTSSVLNPMGSIIRLQDSLQLSAEQADSIASMNRRYSYRVDSLWTPVARHLASLPERYQRAEAYARFLSARRVQVDMLTEVATALQALLTPSQQRKLPPQITQSMDPRFLALVRNGTGLYVLPGVAGVGPPPAGFIILGGGAAIEFAR